MNDIRLTTSLKNGKLYIETQYPEQLVGGFDKLSAHKVFSLEVDLYFQAAAAVAGGGAFDKITLNTVANKEQEVGALVATDHSIELTDSSHGTSTSAIVDVHDDQPHRRWGFTPKWMSEWRG